MLGLRIFAKQQGRGPKCVGQWDRSSPNEVRKLKTCDTFSTTKDREDPLVLFFFDILLL